MDKRTAVARIEEKRAVAAGGLPKSEQMLPWELATYVAGAFALVIGLSAIVVYIILKVYGEQ